MSRISQRQTPVVVRPQPQMDAPAGDGVTLAQVPRILRRSLAWIVVPTALVAVGAGVFVNVVTPRYTGEAKLILESRDPAFARTAQERADQATPIDEQAVASQVQVAMSRDIAREAIRRLKLVGNPEFDPGADVLGPVQRVLAMLGVAKNPLDRPAEDRVLDAYFDRLLVYPAGKSRILTVEFRSRDAQLAADGANTIAKLYIGALEADKVDTARYASTWLGGNIEGLRKRVAEAEAKVEAYRAKHGLVAATGTAGQTLTGQQLGELSSQLSQARTLRADLAGRVKAIKDLIKDGRAFEIQDVANNEVIRRTVENRIAVRAQLALESRTLLPAHPRIKELRAQLDDLDAQIKSSAERIGRTMENEAKIAEARVASLQAAVDGQQDVVLKGNGNEIQLRALEREAKSQREQLESYLGRYREAAARDAESATPADARIVSRAVVPEIPSFPKKLPIVGFATLVALMLSVGAVLGRALLADPGAAGRAETRPDDAEADGHPAALPARDAFAFPEAQPPGRWSEPPPQEAPALQTAASSAAPPAGFALEPLVARLSGGGRMAGAPAGRTVLVMETRGAGPDGLPTALARALGREAGVVAIDINGPAGDPEAPGLSDIVAGAADFGDAIRSDRGLHRIGAGRTDGEVLFEEPRAVALTIEAMAEVYDWVVCRLSHAPGAADLLALVAGFADSVVIASNAAIEDPDLADLFAIATDAGAGQVLIAQDRPAGAVAAASKPLPELRLSAA